MKRLVSIFTVMLVWASVGLSQVSAQDFELKNDGFDENAQGGQTVAFQAGFVANEIGAVVFVPPEDQLPVRLKRIRLLFGGGDGTDMQRYTIRVRVWQENSLGDPNPGPQVLDEELMITSSTNSFNEIDLAQFNLSFSGPFRVGILVTHNNSPGIARDEDGGNNFPDRNYIFEATLGWVRSIDLLVQGDWVIRAFVSGSGTPVEPDPVCGNGACETGENADNCPADCGGGGAVCGNGMCENGESAQNCPADCSGDGSAAVCGNGICDAGESSATCPGDCQGGALSVLSVSPTSASNDVETAIAIIGGGFQGVSPLTFRIGSTVLENVVVQNDGAATAVLPPGVAAGTYDVIVNGPGGSEAKLSSGFTVVGAAPAAGDSGGCTTATQSGPATPATLPVFFVGLGLFVMMRRRRA